MKGVEGCDKLGEAVKQVAQTLEVEYCRALEHSADGRSLTLRAGVGWRTEPGSPRNTDIETEWMTARVLLTNEPVIIEDLRVESATTAAPPLLLEHGVTSGLSVIIHGRGRPFGRAD